MQKNEQAKKYRDLIADELEKHFKNGELSGDYLINVSTDIPYLMLEMKTSVYKFFTIRIAIERFGLTFSVMDSDIPYCLLHKKDLTFNDINGGMIQKMDKEIRLRIPDKYLKAKGWL